MDERRSFRMVSPLAKHLEGRYQVVLASQSPRRKELLGGLGLAFTIRTLPNIEESYPADLLPGLVPEYLAQKKAAAYACGMAGNELLLTADTVVILGSQILGKPTDRAHAVGMLQQLSGQTHEVVTGVVLKTLAQTVSFSVSSLVDFAVLSGGEIDYYVDACCPFDKAGSYGIQEWIGYIGIQNIRGSFYNVMGLPVQRLYRELMKF